MAILNPVVQALSSRYNKQDIADAFRNEGIEFLSTKDSDETITDCPRLFVASLAGCSRADVDDVPTNERFTSQPVSIHGLGANAYLIKDVKIGKEFLMIHMSGGLSATPL